MDLPAVSSAVEKLGLPLAMLAVAIVALWRMCAYVVTLMEAHRLEREQVQAANIAALGQLGAQVAETGAVVREMKDATARSLDRIEMRVQAASRGFVDDNALMAMVYVAVLLSLLLSLSCAHPVTATAAVQAETTATGEAQAATAAQAGSSAQVVARRGLHLRAHFSPPVDGGAPVFDLNLDDDGQVSAGAIGTADAGAASEADAGAEGAADAGAAAAAPGGSWPPWLLPLAGGVLAVVLGVAAVWRKARQLRAVVP